jgi:hypothetical protein
VKLGSKPPNAKGTPVVCPSCRHPNLGIDIWCERCRWPLDWNGQKLAEGLPPERPARTGQPPKLRIPAGVWPKLTMPRFTLPRLPAPRMPRLRTPRLRTPRVPRLVLAVLAILAVLLIVPLAYVLLPAGRAALAHQTATSHLPSTNGASAADTAQAAAIGGVQSKTHVTYRTGKCAANTPCLSLVSETTGKDAAAVVFSTAGSAARQCVGYVYRSGGHWHYLDAVCGLPDQLSPLVGRDATVHVPGNCANVRDGASLSAAVIACIKDGSTVHLDGGPTYADGRLWWHEPQGWIAHDFLTGP